MGLVLFGGFSDFVGLIEQNDNDEVGIEEEDGGGAKGE